MFEIYYFILGIVNSILLILIFMMAKLSKMAIVKAIGIAYLLLALPATYAVFLALKLDKPVQYSIFLGIFIIYVLLEGFYDYVLKISFRKNWKLLTPYLMLYWSMNYGFIVMSWKHSVTQGSILLGLFIAQIIANMISHTHKKGENITSTKTE